MFLLALVLSSLQLRFLGSVISSRLPRSISTGMVERFYAFVVLARKLLATDEDARRVFGTSLPHTQRKLLCQE